MARWSRASSGLVGLLVMAVLGGCDDLAGPSFSPTSILVAEGDAHSRELAVSLDSCSSRAAQVDVDETLSEVRISARTLSDVDGDCADGATVTLSSPLGDRAVIDESSGDRVAVTNRYGLEVGRLYSVLEQEQLFGAEPGTVREVTATLGVSPTGCATLDGDLVLAPYRSHVTDDNRLVVAGVGTWRVGDAVTVRIVRTEVRRIKQSPDSVEQCLGDLEMAPLVGVLPRSSLSPD